MKEEISQQRGAIGAHWYTNNLSENRAPKTNVDVVEKKVNSETKISTREVCVPHGRPIIPPEGAKRIGSNEAFPFGVKNSFQKITKLVFKSVVWKAYKFTCSQLCDFVGQLVRELHRHRRGHGSEFR